MASVRENRRSAGQVTYSVLFRRGQKQTSETFTTKKAAVRFKNLVDALGAEAALATLVADQDDGLTLDQLAGLFFEWKARDVEARTLIDYRRNYANWIEPTLGERLADSITERDVQQLVDSMAERLDPKSVADRHMLLGSMFKYGSARSRRLVADNPCAETQLPKRKRKPPKGISLAEYYAIQAAADQIEPDAGDLIRFIAATGWRWSEAAALLVRDVEEFPDARDGVERMVVRMTGVMRAGSRVDLAAKSRAGFRSAKLPASTAAMVRRRTVGKGLGDLVFTNAAGRKWYQTNFLERTWTRVLAHAELDGLERRPTPHMLRHAHVALLDRVGVPLAEMQRRLGHEDISTTINVYGGMIDDMSGSALDALDDLLVGRKVPGRVVSGTVVRGALGGDQH